MKKSTDIILYSIVIPYYNSLVIQQLCTDLILFFQSLETAYEIIIVNDSSDKAKMHFLDSLKQNNPNIKVYHFEKNFGQDYSTGFGISKSSGKYIITIDDDLEFPVKEINKLISAIGKSSSEVIYGLPSKHKNSFFRKFSRIFYYALIKLCGHNEFGSFRLLTSDLKEKITYHLNDRNFCIDKLILHEARTVKRILIMNHPKEKSRYGKLKLFRKFLLFFTYRYNK